LDKGVSGQIKKRIFHNTSLAGPALYTSIMYSLLLMPPYLCVVGLWKC